MKESYLKGFDFGNEAGDDELPEVLDTYFVKIPSFDHFLMPSHRLFIATAKKGVGKSALLNWAGYNIEQHKKDSFVIKCTGAELTRDHFNLTTPLKTANDHIRDWMVRICSLINRKLATKYNLAFTDDHITLIESAEIDGFKSRNIIGCLLDRFKKSLGDKQPEKLHSKNEYELLKRLEINHVWLMVDDLDATFQNNKEERTSLSTFFQRVAI